MTTSQHDAFTVLQQCWATHEQLRASNASLAELAASRTALDTARLDAHRAAKFAA